jgi:hypothetical protein
MTTGFAANRLGNAGLGRQTGKFCGLHRERFQSNFWKRFQ